MNHLTEEDQILLYYGEPGIGQDAQAHLGSCGECQAAAASLAQALNLCDELQVPEPSPEFERSVWAQIAPQLTDKPVRWVFSGAFPASFRNWIAIAAMAGLLIGAFLIGRATRESQAIVVAGLSSQARERILEISLADHLDRAGMLLTEISNIGQNADLAPERERAHELVQEGRLLHQTLARRGASSTLGFLDDLERLLTETSHAHDAREIQERIGSESLLFKVRIMESNLRTQGQKS